MQPVWSHRKLASIPGTATRDVLNKCRACHLRPVFSGIVVVLHAVYAPCIATPAPEGRGDCS